MPIPAIAPLRPLLAALGLALLVGAGPLAAQPALAAGDASHLRIGANSYGRTQLVTVALNKSLIVDLPANVSEVIVSQPSVAGAIMRTRSRAIIQGASAGSTNILFLDARGQSIAVLDVSVGGESSTLAATMRRILPSSNISVETFGDRVILSGTARSQDDSARAATIAAQFAGGPEKVANLITLEGVQQVMLQVKIAEVQREALKDLGVNLSGSLSVGQVNLGFNSTQTTLGNGVSGGLSLPNLQINAAIRALTERNSLRLLAEPTLTAMSGTPASFLAGGELPFTVADDSGRRTTEWKPFGVELDFTPTVRSNGLVGLKIRTSVSELRADGALNKREVGTDVELGLGQTLAIGGILQDTTRQQISGLPALGDIPILGALFRSREFRRNQTELVVLVTPYLARPGGQQALPTDDFVVAGDAAAIFLGHMEKMYGVGPAGMRGGYNGSVGFVLD